MVAVLGFVVVVWCRWGRGKATREEEGAQAGACSPLTVQTEASSRARGSGVGEWKCGSGGREEEGPGLSRAHLVLGLSDTS